MTLQEAKHQIALDNNRTDWTHLLYDKGESEVEYYSDMAATLYAKSKFDEAVEEMRAISELDSDVELPTFEA